ncbi:MAG TPA: diguanylate cyclase, partial [Burkholderiaceae bacterium]|nr:diguanylate cyclase [Burkholderiaceae bacterium]
MNPLVPIDAPRTPWWAALHTALMPDYNRKAAAYWWFMALLGLCSLGLALHHLAALPPAAQAQVAIGCAVAMLAGLYPVRIPGSKNSFAAGEIFIFLLLLMHGPSAAVLAAAGEALVGSMRSSKRWTSRLVSPALAAIAMGVAGNTLHAALQGLRALGMLNEVVLLVVAMTFAIGYFLLNTSLITVIPHLKRNEPMRLSTLMGFGWVGITYAASSLIAGLLFLTFEQVGVGVLTAAVPIIAMLLVMLHVYFRKREFDDAAHRVRLEAAERESEQNARHLSELGVSEQRFHSAFSNAAIGMALVSVNGQVLQANASMLALVGRQEHDLVGREFGAIVHAHDAAALAERLTHCALGGDAASIELRINHPTGQEVWVSIHTGTFADGAIAVPRLILQAQDITARRSAETRLQHIAYHDHLTGLANRARFRDGLAGAIERCRADPTRGFAVMYLDFDRFKLINDTLGHSAGDQFLVVVAQRIVRQVRPTDIVGRLGGDEFAILVEQTGGEEMALALAERLQQTFREPFQLDGTEVNSSASIGITFSSVGYETPDEVLRDADIAMYRAKASGRARHALFDTALRSQLSDQVRLEADLRQAIEHDQIKLAFQPIFDLASGRIVSFEALARWTHAERGPVPPQRFIAVAEESGLIGRLTERILSMACQQLRGWQASTGNPQLRMQVNLSGIDLCHSGLASHVANLLRAHGIEASQLT